MGSLCEGVGAIHFVLTPLDFTRERSKVKCDFNQLSKDFLASMYIPLKSYVYTPS